MPAFKPIRAWMVVNPDGTPGVRDVLGLVPQMDGHNGLCLSLSRKTARTEAISGERAIPVEIRPLKERK